MPQNDTVTLVPGEWKLLTDTNVSACSFLNDGSDVVWFLPTVGDVEPTSRRGAVPYKPGMGETRDFAEIWKGVPGANRLWAYADHAAQVWFSHA